MLVLDQRQTDMPVAVFAEADAGSHRDLGFLKQQLTELQAAEMGELRRDRRPGEHAGGRAGNLPTGGGQTLDQHVAACLIDGAGLGDAVLRTVERRRGGDLDRREGAVVEVGFDPRQRRDQLLVAGGEADAPARHGIGLAHRRELDRDLAGFRDLRIDGGGTSSK